MCVDSLRTTAVALSSRTGDDHYVSMHNLLLHLADFEVRKSPTAGQRLDPIVDAFATGDVFGGAWHEVDGCDTKYTPGGYLSGGGGVILSRAALVKMAPVIEQATRTVARHGARAVGPWSAHDAFTGRCLYDLGVPIFALGKGFSVANAEQARKMSKPSLWKRFQVAFAEVFGLKERTLPGTRLLGRAAVANVHYVKTRGDMQELHLLLGTVSDDTSA